MFGITQIKLKLKDKYTTQEFYDMIAGAHFEAGVPRLVKYGPAYVIAFPQQDRNNQVQIQSNRKGVVYVTRATTPIGLEHAVGNMIMEDLTGGLSGMSVLGGKKKKLCEELVKKTAAQLESMNL